ncbi:MAG: glycosyltransferase family 39 protein [Thermoguttaceae bacterium]|nr:glycosyltransferase family 39 protein [Thermoguttaceae bacterium]MDW8039479.1 glycosyltransferase family 39 protein [Thermoguttaceae bacterium]
MEPSMRISARAGVWLALLLFGAFLVRVAGAVWWQYRVAGPQDFFFPDSHSYWHLAQRIAFGQPYQFGTPDAQVFRMPGYPMVLAPVFWLGGQEAPVLWGRLWGAVLGVVPVGCCWWLSRRLFGPPAGWWASLIAAGYPEAVAASIFILSEAAFCPMMALQLVLIVLAWQSRHPCQALGFAFGAGLLGGAGTLIRASWLWFTPLTAFCTIFATCGPIRLKISNQQSDSDKAIPKSATGPTPCSGEIGKPNRDQASAEGLRLGTRLAMAGLMVAGMVLVMLPWWIRNYRVVGRWVPTTLQLGASLYDGLRAGATGKSDMSWLEDFARSERWLLSYRGPAVQMLDPDRWQQPLKQPLSSACLQESNQTGGKGGGVGVERIGGLTTPADVLVQAGQKQSDFGQSSAPEVLPGQHHPPVIAAAPENGIQPVLWEDWLDRALAEEAIRWASRHPDQVVRLGVKKLWRMWTPWPNEPTLAASPLAAVVAGTYLAILATGLLALGQTGRRPRIVFLLALPALYLSLVHSIFVSSVRYRGPAMLGWIVLAAGWVAEKIHLQRYSPAPLE